MVVCRDVSAMLPTLSQRNKHPFLFFLFAQECNDLKRHLGMDGMQKWQRNARVRKFPNKRVDDLIAHRTSLSNRTFATKRTKFNFVWHKLIFLFLRNPHCFFCLETRGPKFGPLLFTPPKWWKKALSLFLSEVVEKIFHLCSKSKCPNFGPLPYPPLK